jgi:hypothetical protein
MESYKRAIHTGWDYHLAWVLMGHTIPDTDGTSFICHRYGHAFGKLRRGKVMQLSSSIQARPGA